MKTRITRDMRRRAIARLRDQVVIPQIEAKKAAVGKAVVAALWELVPEAAVEAFTNHPEFINHVQLIDLGYFHLVDNNGNRVSTRLLVDFAPTPCDVCRYGHLDSDDFMKLAPRYTGGDHVVACNKINELRAAISEGDEALVELDRTLDSIRFVEDVAAVWPDANLYLDVAPKAQPVVVRAETIIPLIERIRAL